MEVLHLTRAKLSPMRRNWSLLVHCNRLKSKVIRGGIGTNVKYHERSALEPTLISGGIGISSYVM